jgi:hypothetical protein
MRISYGRYDEVRFGIYAIHLYISRSDGKCRAAFIADSATNMREKLELYLENGRIDFYPETGKWRQGNVKLPFYLQDRALSIIKWADSFMKHNLTLKE